MIKKAQKTRLDDILEDTGRNPKPWLGEDKQLQLVRQDTTDPVASQYGWKHNKPIWNTEINPVDYEARREKYREIEKNRKEERDPIPLSYPELTPEQIKFRKLNDPETKKLLEEGEREYNKKRYLYLDPNNRVEVPEVQKYFDLNERPQEDIKKEILEAYNSFRKTAAQFEAAYKDANMLATTDTSFDYSGSYVDIFKRIPDFIERVTRYGIGTIFGVNVDRSGREHNRNSSEAAIRLLKFIRSGINLFNITPLNIEEKKEEMKVAAEDMAEILKEYEKRKRVSIKLPKMMAESSAAFLRRRDNREFLKWLDQYFPTEKKNFLQGSVEDILRPEGISRDTFSLHSLSIMKSYQEIYYKTYKTTGFELRMKLENKARKSIIDNLSEEVKAIVAPKIDKLSDILISAKDNLSFNDKIDTGELEKFLFDSFKFDLRGIFQFCQLVFKSRYDADVYQQEFLNFKRNFLDDLYKALDSSVGMKDLFSRDLFVDTIKSYLQKISPSGGATNREELSKLPGDEINKLANNYIARLMVETLPNFKDRRGSPNAYKYPPFNGVGKIIKQTGRLNIENTVNLALNKVPFVPREFIVALVKSAFKATISPPGDMEPIVLNSTEIFEKISYFEGTHYQLAMKVLLEILKNANKYNQDNFVNYFKKSYRDLFYAVSHFSSNYGKFKELSEQEATTILANIFKHPDYIERDKDQFEKFIKYIHDDAADLSKKDLTIILSNSNYTSYNKVGIARKLLNCVAMIRSSGGVNKIMGEYKDKIPLLQEKGFISKNFDKNIRYIMRVFNSGKNITPAHPEFKKIFDLIATIETDIQLLEISEAMKELVQNYQKKDTRLFKLNYDINPILRFRVLKDMDPRILRIGIETNCCQRIGGVGEEAARQSFVNPLAGVVILEWLDEGDWKILTQSYFHYVPDNNGYILDNVEYNAGNYLKSKINLEAAYALLAQKMKTKFDIGYLLAGKSYSKLSTNKFKTHKLRGGDPRFFSDKAKVGNKTSNYSDFSPGDAIDLLNPKFDLEKAIPSLLAISEKKSEALEILANRFLKLATK